MFAIEMRPMRGNWFEKYEPPDMWRSLRRRWRLFWFEPGSARALAACRILFYAGVLVYYRSRDVTLWADVSPIFWKPEWLFDGRLRLPGLASTHPVISHDGIAALRLAWIAALAFSAVGAATRVSSAAAFGLAIYLIGLPANFGHSGHQYQLVVFVLAILAVARTGDCWSVDSWIRDRIGRDHRAAIDPGEYTWPIRAVWFSMAFVFAAAGIAKLRHSGLGWVTSNTLANYLVVNSYLGNTSVDPLTSWGPILAGYAVVCHLAAAAVLFTELAFPLALLHQRLRAVLVPASFVMMIAWRALLGPPFELFMWCYLFWVPWERIFAVFPSRPTARPRAARDTTESRPAKAVVPHTAA
jgi:hypothetical protein